MATKYRDKDIRWKWLEEKGYNVLADDLQYEYMQALWSPTDEIRSVFVNAKAGTGKTTLAVAGGIYAVDKCKYDRIIYVRNTVAVRDQGFLPGNVGEKEEMYFLPLLDALDSLASHGYESWYNTDKDNRKIEMVSTSYLRGVNFKNAYIIIDEAQNLSLTELQTILTRPHDNCKIVVIGSVLQNDNPKIQYYSGLSPFQVYIKHFEEEKNANVKLLTNYRGEFSQHADNVGQTIAKLKAGKI